MVTEGSGGIFFVSRTGAPVARLHAVLARVQPMCARMCVLIVCALHVFEYVCYIHHPQHYIESDVPRLPDFWPCTANCSHWCHRDYCYGSCLSKGQQSAMSAARQRRSTALVATAEVQAAATRPRSMLYMHPFISTERGATSAYEAASQLRNFDGSETFQAQCAYTPMFLGMLGSGTIDLKLRVSNSALLQ